jgi:hypothetical protein
MSSLDTRPLPPETPVFSNQMAGFLVATARANSNPVRRTSPLVPVLGVVVALAIAVGATIALSRSDAPRTVAVGAVHVHLAAFSVDTDAGGTVTVTLNRNEISDPEALRQALAQADVPTVINVGSVCYNPHPDRGEFFQVVALHQSGPDGTDVMVITPSKMPSGSKLSIGYIPNGHNAIVDGVRFTLLMDGLPVTCNDSPPPPQGQPTPAPGPVPPPSS